MTNLTARESEVIAAARALIKITHPEESTIAGSRLSRLRDAVETLDAPIGVGEVLAAFREERAAIRALFADIEPGHQDALLLAWDEARERYTRLLAEYAEGIGLTVRKAERGLAAHLAAFEAMEAAR